MQQGLGVARRHNPSADSYILCRKVQPEIVIDDVKIGFGWKMVAFYAMEFPAYVAQTKAGVHQPRCLGRKNCSPPCQRRDQCQEKSQPRRGRQTQGRRI